MKEFTVSCNVKLTAYCTFIVRAKDEEAAQAKAEKLAEKISIDDWTPKGAPDDCEWNDEDHETEVESVEEA